MDHTTNTCGWCSKPIYSYDKKNSVTETIDHYEWMKDFISGKLNLNENTPAVVRIITYLFNFQDLELCGKPCHLFELLSQKHYNCHLTCMKITSTKTRSGRRSERGKLLCNENFVPGSGISGCDRFDMGYDNGAFHDKEKFLPNHYSIHSDFVVPDDELLPTDCDSEEEMSECFSSSEDEIDDEDRDWD